MRTLSWIYLQLFAPIIQQQWCLNDNLNICDSTIEHFNLVSKVALAATWIKTYRGCKMQRIFSILWDHVCAVFKEATRMINKVLTKIQLTKWCFHLLRRVVICDIKSNTSLNVGISKCLSEVWSLFIALFLISIL